LTESGASVKKQEQQDTEVNAGRVQSFQAREFAVTSDDRCGEHLCITYAAIQTEQTGANGNDLHLYSRRTRF